MKENTNISVILPVHELNEVTKPMFANAVKSVELQKVQPDELVIVTPKGSETLKYIKSFDFGTIKSIVSIVENDGETDFASQINLGVSQAKSEWVSFLEYDDEYANIWFKNVVEYKKAHENVGLFMPIIVDTDANGNFIGFTNEAVWANSFSDELGVLDLNALLTYQNFSIDGIVIKKSIYEEFGGFKPSIKLTFIYEFLLRMTFKDVRVMAIPRFGYKHVNQRPDSLFEQYKESMDPAEARWWLSQAKKEYYFEKDRKITYQTQTA
jgi:glycosyltransferase involved in cell wall biosynthesis